MKGLALTPKPQTPAKRQAKSGVSFTPKAVPLTPHEHKIPEMSARFDIIQIDVNMGNELAADIDILNKKSQLLRSSRMANTRSVFESIATPNIKVSGHNSALADRLLELEQRVNDIAIENKTEIVLEQLGNFQQYVESRFKEFDRKIEVLLSVKTAKKKSSEQEQINVLSYQLQVAMDGQNQEVEEMKTRLAGLEAKQKVQLSKMAKIKPIIQLDQHLISNIAGFDKWADQVAFSMSKLEARLAKLQKTE